MVRFKHEQYYKSVFIRRKKKLHKIFTKCLHKNQHFQTLRGEAKFALLKKIFSSFLKLGYFLSI